MAARCEATFSDGVGPVLDGVHHRLVDTIAGGFCGGASSTPVLVGEREAPDCGADLEVPGVSVSHVGRRYDVNANLIFKLVGWMR